MKEVFSGNRDQMMASRSSQTAIIYCSSQNSRHLWITIYGSVWIFGLMITRGFCSLIRLVWGGFSFNIFRTFPELEGLLVY